MKQYFVNLLLAVTTVALFSTSVSGQEMPLGDGMEAPLSGNAMAVSHFENTPVNYYTGIPYISIPLYKYTNLNGLHLNVSLDYAAGGINVNQGPTTAGLGWNLSSGGMVVRTVRGMPDDYPHKGFLYAPSVTNNYRVDGTKYYYDSLDAQQDVFQFSFNGRSGKFYIGKDKKIVCVPLSKIRIGFTAVGDTSAISSFYIITEDGIKYVFDQAEMGSSSDTVLSTGCHDFIYSNAWHLSCITSIMGKDSIKFSYTAYSQDNYYEAVRTGLIPAGSNTISKYTVTIGEQAVRRRKIESITFPDKKKVSFVYDPFVRYDRFEYCLNSMHVSDSIFRYGYQFQWCDSGRSFLAGVRYYTSTKIKSGYQFIYNTPYFKPFGDPGDSLSNKRDHWGYYNANTDTTKMPNIPGVFNGANREPNGNAIAGTLSTIIEPSGGKTLYTFENNDIYRTYNIEPQYRFLNCKNATSTSITLDHVAASSDTFHLMFPDFSAYFGEYPFSGASKLICSVTNTTGTITYAADSIGLAEMFDEGSKNIVFSNIPDGSYLFKTQLSSGSTVTSHSLMVSLSWNNQVPVTVNKIKTGGIRIKQIAHYDPVTNRTDTISTYKYELPNGRSSGFLGVSPVYQHPYMETYIEGADVGSVNYTAISAQPVNNMNYIQGSPVGYSRVEVYKGSLANNLGKQVYEYTTLQDAGASVHPEVFPYTPTTQRDWALGLAKKITVYDSAGTVIQETVNTYNTINIAYIDTAFKSLKLGLLSTIYYHDGPTTIAKYNNYVGGYYFPESGRSDLVSSTQTFYYPDNSKLEKIQQVEYDSNYNTVKITSSYNKTQNLFQERRIYYPYNYTIGGAIGALKDSGIFVAVSTEDWILGDNNPRLLNISVTNFDVTAGGVIRPTELYELKSKSPVSQSIIGTFNSSLLVRNSALIQKIQEFVVYDSSGNCLEIKKSKSQQSETCITDYAKQFIVAKVSNAKFIDVAYTSFESDGSGNWSIPSTDRILTTAITGKKSYDLTNGAITKSGLNSSLTYIISYWKLSGASVSITNASNTELIAEQRGWQLYTLTVTGIASVTVSGSGTIDELRLYPKDANMSTSTYEPTVGVTSTCDANNTINYYEYDNVNRVVLLRDKDYNIVKKYEYSDVTIDRNFVNPETVYMLAGDRYNSQCMYFTRYQDQIMSDGHPEQTAGVSQCNRNMAAGLGL